MADFCQECSIDTWGEDTRDMAGLCKNGGAATVLCEGCGLINVDVNGKRLCVLKTPKQLKEEFTEWTHLL